MHHIQHDILERLATVKQGRFRDLHPENVEANLYSYHLKTLTTQGYVEKHDRLYTLSAKGLSFADRLSEGKVLPRLQPKIITMTVVTNEHNEVFMLKRKKQPFIDTWTVPSGKIHLEDTSVSDAALREVREKTGLQVPSVVRIGEAYIRVKSGDGLISSVMAHVYAARIPKDSVPSHATGEWTSSSIRSARSLSPALGEIIDSSIAATQRFYEEYTIEWESPKLDSMNDDATT